MSNVFFHLTPNRDMVPDVAFEPTDGCRGGTLPPRLFVTQHPRYWLPWFGIDGDNDPNLDRLFVVVFDLSGLEQGNVRWSCRECRWIGDSKDWLRGCLEGPPEAWIYPHAYERLVRVEVLPYREARRKYNGGDAIF